MVSDLEEQQSAVESHLSPNTMDEIYKAVSQLNLRHGHNLPGTEEEKMTYILLLIESVAIRGYNDGLLKAREITMRHKYVRS